MPQRERQTCARDRRKAETLGEIATEILGARDLVWAGWLAAPQLSQEDGAAIGELLDTVANRRAALAEKARHADQQEGSTDAA